MAEPRAYDQFMAAFNEVEDYLKRSLYGNQDLSVPFGRMLDEFRVRRPHKLLPRHYNELKVLSDLRNSLTHGRQINGQRLAEPTATGLEAMRHVRDQFLHPPTVLTVLKQQRPMVVEPTSSVRQVLDQMYEHDFSQVPVYESTTYVGLLTTNTVARWVADQMRTQDGLAEDASIEAALAFTEGTELVMHEARTVTTTEAVRSFTIAAERHQPITALIVSHSGKPNELPLAVVVSADLPLFSGL